MTPDAFTVGIFAGTVRTIGPTPAIDRLVAVARAAAEDAFCPHPPEHAEWTLPPPAFQDAARAAVSRFAEDPATRDAWLEIVGALGFAADALYFDRLKLRIQPSQPSHRGRRTSPLPPHRDTWGSNIAAQINWWGPVYPLADERTMWLWPGLFDRPVRNTSADWDLAVLRRLSMAGQAGGYPLLPEAAEMPDRAMGQPVRIEPGQIIAFSAAHLHASADNTSGRTRFSIDTRTVWQSDLAAGRGAPNVDGAAPRVGWDLFQRLTDGAPLEAS